MEGFDKKIKLSFDEYEYDAAENVQPAFNESFVFSVPKSVRYNVPFYFHCNVPLGVASQPIPFVFPSLGSFISPFKAAREGNPAMVLDISRFYLKYYVKLYNYPIAGVPNTLPSGVIVSVYVILDKRCVSSVAGLHFSEVFESGVGSTLDSTVVPVLRASNEGRFSVLHSRIFHLDYSQHVNYTLEGVTFDVLLGTTQSSAYSNNDVVRVVYNNDNFNVEKNAIYVFAYANQISALGGFPLCSFISSGKFKVTKLN